MSESKQHEHKNVLKHDSELVRHLANAVKAAGEHGDKSPVIIDLAAEKLEADPAKAEATIRALEEVTAQVEAETGAPVVLNLHEDPELARKDRKGLLAAGVIGLGMLAMTACKKSDNTTVYTPPTHDTDTVVITHPHDTDTVIKTIYVVGKDSAFITKGGDTIWKFTPGQFSLATRIFELYGDKSSDVAALNAMTLFNKGAVYPGYYPFPSQLPTGMARATIGTVNPNDVFEQSFATALDAIGPSAYLPGDINGRKILNYATPGVIAAQVDFLKKAAGFEQGAYIYGVNDYLSKVPGSQANLQTVITQLRNQVPSKPLVFADCHNNTDVLKTILSKGGEVTFHWFGLDNTSYLWARNQVAEVIKAAEQLGIQYPVINMVNVVPSNTVARLKDDAKLYNQMGDYAKQITKRHVVPTFQVYNSADGSFLTTQDILTMSDPSLPTGLFKTTGPVDRGPFGDPRNEGAGYTVPVDPKDGGDLYTRVHTHSKEVEAALTPSYEVKAPANHQRMMDEMRRKMVEEENRASGFHPGR